MVYSPIYKNTYYSLTTGVAYYKIMLDGEQIYSGRAVKYPDADYLQINLDKVCRNYLSSDIDDLLNELPVNITRQYHYNAQRQFDLMTGNSLAESYIFYNDWSYTTDKNVQGTVNVSAPITGHYVPGMMRLKTTRMTGNSPVVYTEGYVGNPSRESEYFGYTKQVKCTPYVLYYLNSYGGWDAFVIEGNTNKKDAYTTYTTDQSYDNTTLEFEYNKYVQEIKTTYTMNTGLLNDEQSENFAKNLVGSLKVYLHNIPEGWIKPVVITDNSVDYQTYTTNGKKLSNYKLTVQESQSKIRLN